MSEIPNSLLCVLLFWSAATAALAVLVTYRAALARKEDDSLYLNKAEEMLMVGEQDVLVAKVNHLRRPIVALAVVSGVLLVTSAGMWLWMGFMSF